jgi:anthranilate 1,2-dioxygenase small subunit
MLRDRVLSLREANIYNIHVDRHIVGNVRVGIPQQGIYSVRSNYVILQTDAEGKTIIFSAGEYLDQVVFIEGRPKFKERVVIPDTYLAIGVVGVPL